MHVSFFRRIPAVLLSFLFYAVFSISVWSVELTSQEQDWLSEHEGVIRFVYHPNYMPVEFLDKQNQPAGIMVDYIRWMGAQVGFAPEFYPEVENAQQNVLQGKYDAKTSLWYSHKLADQFGFTAVIMGMPISIFVTDHSDIHAQDDLSGRVVALSPHEKILQNLSITCVEKRYPEVEAQLTALVSGQVDALVGIDQVVLYYTYRMGLGDRIRRVGEPLFTGRSCIGINSTNQILQSILAKGVDAARKEGLVRRLQRQWIGPEYSTLGSRIFRYIRYITIGTGILLAAVLLFWIWDIRLSRRVFEKTEQLRKSEERLRTIFQNSPDAIFIEDDNGVILDANPGACAFHRLSHSELVGKNSFDLVSAGRREEEKRHFCKWFTGEIKRCEGSSQDGNGREVPVEVIGAPLRFEGRSAVLLLMRDMTDRKQAEMALKESELRYRGLIEAQSSFIIRTNAEGLFTFVNKAFYQFLGRTCDELIGKDSRAHIYRDDIAIQEKAIESLILRRERVVTVECRMRARTRIAWVRWENIPIFDESGCFVEIQSVGHDITELHRIYEVLQESEKRLRFLFEEVPHIAVHGYNAARETIFWNRASEKLYNYSKKDALGKKMEELVIPPDRCEELIRSLGDMVEPPRHPTPAREVINKTAEGTPVAIYSSHLATCNHRGEWEIYIIDVNLSEITKTNDERGSVKGI